MENRKQTPPATNQYTPDQEKELPSPLDKEELANTTEEYLPDPLKTPELPTEENHTG